MGDWSFTPGAVLPEGDHLITATAQDKAGNLSPGSDALHFVVDTIPPAAPVMTSPGDFVATHTPNILGTAEPGSTVTVSLDGDAALGAVVADARGNWGLTPSTELAEGLHPGPGSSPRTRRAMSAPPP